MYPVRVDLCISDWFPAKTLTCMSVSRTITQIKIQNIPLNPFVWEFREQVLKGKREVEKEKKYKIFVMSVPSSMGLCSSGGQTGTAEYCTARYLEACRGSRNSDRWNVHHWVADTPPASSLCHLHRAWCTEERNSRNVIRNRATQT